MTPIKPILISIDKLKYYPDTIFFNPPVKVEVYEYPDDNLIFFQFDFGMEIRRKLKDSYIEDSLTSEQKAYKFLEFELVHSFCHPPEDPNYTELNWALYGNLKDRVTIEEKLDEE